MSCCKAWDDTLLMGTDNEGYANLRRGGFKEGEDGEDDETLPREWWFGSYLPPVRFCPWCGTPAPPVPADYDDNAMTADINPYPPEGR